MPPKQVLIRHAQAIHNIDITTRALPLLQNPFLTDLGRQQESQLREHFESHLPPDRKVQLIVVCPMRRAIQTCLIALDWLIDSGVPVVPSARWRDIYPKPCDTGTPALQLAAEFRQIDFSCLDPVYPDRTSPAGARYAYEKGAILARGQCVAESVPTEGGRHCGLLALGVSEDCGGGQVICECGLQGF